MKSTIYDDFTIEQKLNRTNLFIADGGYLLHAVAWNNDFCKTYHVIWNVQKIISCRHKYLSVVFDSYDELDSAKKSEHLHRYRHITTLFQIPASTSLYCNQGRFFVQYSEQETVHHHADYYTSK